MNVDNHLSGALRTILTAMAVLLGVIGLGGCLADTAEDTELPWASTRSWEGMAPIAPTIMDRYE